MQINSKENYSWEINTMQGVEIIENIDKYIRAWIDSRWRTFSTLLNITLPAHYLTPEVFRQFATMFPLRGSD